MPRQGLKWTCGVVGQGKCFTMHLSAKVTLFRLTSSPMDGGVCEIWKTLNVYSFYAASQPGIGHGCGLKVDAKQSLMGLGR